MSNPYSNLPDKSFWRTGVAQASPLDLQGIYTKKFDISHDCRIATAGSCFAQHISKHLSSSGFTVLDVEPPPAGLPTELHHKFGFSMYSARYGNIYTSLQLLQLAKEVSGLATPSNIVWTRDGSYYDALRPAVEPEGLASECELMEHRRWHIARVRELFESMDLFIFTLGLTEAWVHQSGTVYPTAPGVVAGSYDEREYHFQNFNYNDVVNSFKEFQRVIQMIRGSKDEPKYLLTVSPVPLVATATDNHALVATTQSKAVLRAAAGFLSEQKENVDYFPSYEIITNQVAKSQFYKENFRSITAAGVETVMRSFFSEHKPFVSELGNTLGDAEKPSAKTRSVDDVQCEDALLEQFGK